MPMQGRTWASGSHRPRACASSIPSSIVGGQPPGQLCFVKIQIVQQPTFSKKRERKSRECANKALHFVSFPFSFYCCFFFFFCLFLGLLCKIADVLLPWKEDYDVIGLPGLETQETAYLAQSRHLIMLTKQQRKCPKKGKLLL